MLLRILVSACVALLVASCGAPETLPPDVTVTVELRDYSVRVTPATVKAGAQKIGIRNAAGMVHEFELIRTDLAPDKLPVEDAKAKLDGLVKQVLNIAPGKVAVVNADLAPGHYVVICDVAGHYQLGMHAELRVE